MDPTFPTPTGFERVWASGEALMSLGAASVVNPNVTPNTLAFVVKRTTTGARGNLTWFITPGTGLTVNSDSGSEAGFFDYLFIEKG